MDIKHFPWDKGRDPFWVNPDNGLEWYIDKSSTDWCYKYINDLPQLNAVCFFVARRENDNVIPISRVLIDKKTNGVLAEHTGVEEMCVKIELLRLSLAYDKQDDGLESENKV